MHFSMRNCYFLLSSTTLFAVNTFLCEVKVNTIDITYYTCDENVGHNKNTQLSLPVLCCNEFDDYDEIRLSSNCMCVCMGVDE